MSDDPTAPDANRGLTESMRPIVAAMVELTESQITNAITPLMAQITGLEVMVTEQAARIAKLEARVSKLTDDW